MKRRSVGRRRIYRGWSSGVGVGLFSISNCQGGMSAGRRTPTHPCPGCIFPFVVTSANLATGFRPTSVVLPDEKPRIVREDEEGEE